MEKLIDIQGVIKIAPVVTVTITVLLVGWLARGWAENAHITTLKEFIEYLKNKKDQ